MTGTIFRQGTDITQGLLNLRMPLPRSSLREWRCFFTTLSFLLWYPVQGSDHRTFAKTKYIPFVWRYCTVNFCRSYTLLVKRACLPSNFVKLFRQIVEAIEKGEYDGQKHVF